jgi:predicted transposase/invertase (TIGR01784 family)
MTTRNMISFDWAMKRLLRSKANFEVLEGFLSELLRRKIKISHIAESESNKESPTDKFNRVDILVEADGHEMVIVELQYDGEDDYFQRMLYGTGKVIIEHIDEGNEYSAVRKVYSVNIVYFDLGEGDDYVYRGATDFTGLHTQSELRLTAKQQQLYGKTVPRELYPEYYIIKVRKFNDVAKDTLDEWIYYLKHNKIRDDFTAQGLDRARQILAFDNLSDAEKITYRQHVKENRIRNSEIVTAFTDGEIKGMKKGEAERDRLKAEKETAQAEKEAAQAEKEAAQAEKEAAQAEKEIAQTRLNDLDALKQFSSPSCSLFIKN